MTSKNWCNRQRIQTRRYISFGWLNDELTMADGEEQEQIVLNCTQRRTDMANEATAHSKKTTNSSKACHKNRPNPQQKGNANLVRTQAAPSDSQQAKKKEYPQHKMKNSQPNLVNQSQLKTPISATGLIIPSQVRHKKPHNHSRNANRSQKGHKMTENTQHKPHVCSSSPCQNNQMRGSQVHKNVDQERHRQTERKPFRQILWIASRPGFMGASLASSYEKRSREPVVEEGKRPRH